MPYTNLQILRKELADEHRTATDYEEGDANTKVFQLAHKHIKTDSYSVYVNSSVKQDGVDYNIDKDGGVITFENAPPLNHDILIDYQYSAFTDEELTEWLNMLGSVGRAKVKCLEILLMDAARRFDYQTGQSKMSPSQVFKQIKEMLEMATGQSNNQSYGGAVIAKRTHPKYQSTVPQKTDLSRYE